MKTAIILFNLGGPDSNAAIKPFLFNFFTDPNIVRLPAPFRWLLAKRIASRRTKREAGTSYGLIGGHSPLLDNTKAQAAALEKALGADKKVFICMRYWHPMAADVVEHVRQYAPERILLLPLYPQYSTTTTRSSYQAWQQAAAEAGLDVPTTLVCCYPTDASFVAASAALIRAQYDAASAEAREKGAKPPRLLFSAHGLPESIIRDGDPYQWQCLETAKAIVASLKIPDLDWTVCYQSRVGRQQWIKPSTDTEIERAAADGAGLVIYPLAFTQEHVETLAEIEIEYRHKAKELGVPFFYRVPTVGVTSDFIAGLAALVMQNMDKSGIRSNEGPPLCPKDFRRCCQRDCAA